MFGFRRKRTSDKKEIVISVESLETRVAVLESGKLEDLKIEHPTEERIVGSIYKGIVQNLEDGLQAAFVNIGMKKNTFVHYWDMFPEDLSRLEALEGSQGRTASRRRQFTKAEIQKHFPVGSEIIVQVSKGPIGTKGPRVTASLSIPSRYFVLMPGSKLRGISRKIEDAKERKRLKKVLSRLPVPQDAGLIIRTAGSGASSTSFVRDMRSLLDSWESVQTVAREKPAPCCLYEEPGLVERVVRDSVTEDIDTIVIDSPTEYERVRGVFARISRRARSRVKLHEGPSSVFHHYGVDSQIEDVFRRKVVLKSGGYIVFDETEALIAIDVNTGQHRGTSSQDEAIFQVNKEAVVEVARHLRLRNIGGLVVIDLIDMRQKKHRNIVYHELKEALRRDKARTNVLQISSLGLLEMTRQRVDESVESSMYVDCPYCHGRGNVKSRLNMSVEIQRQIQEVIRKSGKKEGMSLRITVNPAILNRLREEDEELLVNMEKKFNGSLSFLADPNTHMEDISIVNAETGAPLFSSRSTK
ncbi:ribonuclease E/G [Verrucomicrobiota bacterium]